MSSLKPFDPDTTCPKCGGTLIRTNHHQERQYFKMRCSLTFREHMHRRCEGCGYEWAEAPLDRVKQPEKEVPS